MAMATIWHFHPSSPLFKPHERKDIIVSDIGLTAMSCVLYFWTQEVGLANFAKLYLVPYIVRSALFRHIFFSLKLTDPQSANHWTVMLTYLHHSDPTIPYFRNKQWSFLRGAISTVDRPLFSWTGRFFHKVSHDHVSDSTLSCLGPFTDYANAVVGSEFHPDTVLPTEVKLPCGAVYSAHPNSTSLVEDVGRGRSTSCNRRGHIKKGGSNHPVGERAIDDVGVALVYDPHGVGQSS
jgi:hypothetical protein